MDNPLVRFKGLDAYTVEELEDRAHELWLHNRMLLTNPTYADRYMHGEGPDPMEGYTRGNPWYSLEEIEEHLKTRR